MRTKVLCAVAALALCAPSGARAADGDDTGVEPGLIRIGVHAPFTGASPVQVDAFVAGLRMYWSYLHEDLGILVNGRRVEVVVADDQYTPVTAVSVCNDMAQSSFLLVGFSGADQLGACATFAGQRGIPYLAPGLSNEIFDASASAFALSTPWERQSPIVAQYIANVLGEDGDRYGHVPMRLPILDLPLPLVTQPGLDGEVRVGLVRSDGAQHDGLHESLDRALTEHGLELHPYLARKDGFDEDARSIARAMQADDIDVAVLAMPQLFTLGLLRNFASQDYAPHLLMYGMTSGINSIASVGCGDPGQPVDGSSAFSAWPGWRETDAGAFDPAFHQSAMSYAPEFNDEDSGDVLLASWGLMKQVHAMLDAAGT